MVSHEFPHGRNPDQGEAALLDVLYPGRVEIYYKLVWQAVDKQIFVDQNILKAQLRRGNKAIASTSLRLEPHLLLKWICQCL